MDLIDQYWHHHCVSYQISADEMGLGRGSLISNETVHNGVGDASHKARSVSVGTYTLIA
jgi:hypothetical protein